MKHPKKNKRINNFKGAPSIAPGIIPGTKPEDLKTVKCKCGVTNFIPISTLKHASLFQTTVGQPMLVNFQGGYACLGCGKLNDFAIEGQEDAEETNK